MLKISELARAAGVSPSTVHYYMQEGLLTPPTRTSRNMAYYDPRCVQEIRYIQELQTQQYLPLAAIKLLIKAQQNGQAAGHLVEMKSFMGSIFRPVENEADSRNLSLSELASASGLPEDTLKALENNGLLAPQAGDGQSVYDDIDLRAARLFQRLSEIGFRSDDMAIFQPYIAVVRAQTSAIHQIVHRLPEHDKLPLVELSALIKDLKDLIDLRIFRDEARHFDEHGLQGGNHVITSSGS